MDDKVSCLCVTNNRPDYLQRAVSAFQYQTYENRELVLVYSAEDLSTKRLVEELQLTVEQPKFCVVELPGSESDRSLGQKRNAALEAATGKFIMNWDDDDFYHPARIERQMSSLLASRQDACVLLQLTFFDETNQQAYLSASRYWENSLLVRKDVVTNLNLKYPPLPRHEDYHFLNRLLLEGSVYPMNMPQLYVYRIHPKNTSLKRHNQQLLKHSRSLGEKVSAQLASIKLGAADFAEAGRYLDSDEFVKAFNYSGYFEKRNFDGQPFSSVELARINRVFKPW